MINKSNEATPQRPEGSRVINGNLVTMDLNASILQLQNESTWKESERNALTLFKSDEVRIVLMGLHKGAMLPTHTAPGRIVVQVLEGQINFTAEGITNCLEKGQALTLEKNLPHSVEAIAETFFLLTMAISK